MVEEKTLTRKKRNKKKPVLDETLARARDELWQTADRAYEHQLARLAPALRLRRKDEAYLLRACRIALTHRLLGQPTGAADFADVPSALLRHDARVFITVLHAGRIRACMSAKKGSLIASAIAAAENAAQDERFGGSLRPDELPRLELGAALVFAPQVVESHEPAQMEHQIELGVHAVSLEREGRKAFFKASVPVEHGYDMKTTLRKLALKAKLPATAYLEEDAIVTRHQSLEFSEAVAEPWGEVALCEKLRGVALLRPSEVTRERIEAGLVLAGEYFAHHASTERIFTYLFNPRTLSAAPDAGGSNLLRRLASLWAFIEIARRSGDRVRLQLCSSILDATLARFFVEDEDKGYGYVLVEGEATIGQAAFLLLGLTRLGEAHHGRAADGLVRFLTSMEDRERGLLRPTYLPEKPTDENDPRQIYYPGEALTALATRHEETGDPALLATVERVFPFYRKLFERTVNFSLVPWLSKAYAKTFFATQARPYAEFVLGMNDRLVERQRGLDDGMPDRIGAFDKTGRSYSTAVYVEALAEAFLVARELGDEQRMKRYQAGMLLGLRYVLQSQIRPVEVAGHEVRDLLLGGLRTTLYDHTIRIDSVQHAALAMMRTLDALALKY